MKGVKKMKNKLDKIISCQCGCGFNSVIPQVFELVQFLDGFGYKISSVCRCKKHNKEVGGSPRSQHLLGRALDVHVSQDKIEEMIKMVSFLGAQKIIKYSWGIHIDFRKRS